MGDDSDTLTVATTGDEPQPLAILRPDGLGPVDLGTLAEDAIGVLADLLGPADHDEPIPPGAECADGSSWLDCVSAGSVLEVGRLLVWDDLALKVAFVDAEWNGGDRQRTPLQFGTWEVTVGTGDGTRLTTAEGIYPGMTIGRLRPLTTGVDGAYDEGSLTGYRAPVPGGGGYHGGLDPDPSTAGNDYPDQIRAVQAALNARGADLVVDGTWGPRSEAAWIAFLEQQQIAPAWPTSAPWLVPEIGDALGFPTDTMTITSISPSPPL